MLHHDNRDYNTAVAETLQRFQAQLLATITRSQDTAQTVIDRVQRDTPTDRIAASPKISVTVDEADQHTLLLSVGTYRARMHKNALDQLATRAGLPGLFITRLLDRPYGRELIAQNLSTIMQKEDPTKLLLREVDGEIRGIMSSSYKRLDSAPIIDAFAGACHKVGAVPIEGVGGDLRWAVKAILPQVYQPSTKHGTEEAIAFGIQLSNSDYGHGALGLNMFAMRIACTNYATMEQVMRQVHLGKRLDDNIEFSAETYKADTRTQVLAVRDMVHAMLDAPRINALVTRIGQALEQRIDVKKAWLELPKLGLQKSEIEQVKALFVDGDIEQLPRGVTIGRLSNAVSWFAKSAATPERRLALEQMAGTLLLPTATTAASVAIVS